MKDVLYMAWRYLRFYWGKTAVLVASISLILFLPAGLNVLVERAAEVLTARAEATPLLIGAKGSAVDLTLSALYFRPPHVEPIGHREVTRVDSSGLARGIPLHLRFTVGRQRIVGTTLDYAEFRGLRVDRGRWLAMLGCVGPSHSGTDDTHRVVVSRVGCRRGGRRCDRAGRALYSR